MRQKEQFNLKVTRYRTPEGNPTCGIDFEKGDVCRFCGVKFSGLIEICMISNERIFTKDGFTVPTKTCPIWKDAT